MFPDVQTEDRGSRLGDDSLHEGVFLVGGGGDEKLSISADAEPGPAGTEASGGGGVELGLHLVKAAEIVIDLGLDGTDGGNVCGSGLGHEGPEHCVVVVTATGVDDGGADGLWERRDVCLDSGEGEALEGGTVGTIEHFVDVTNVGLVVLGVMDVHGGGVDVGLEGVIGVGEGWESEIHVGSGGDERAHS